MSKTIKLTAVAVFLAASSLVTPAVSAEGDYYKGTDAKYGQKTDSLFTGSIGENQSGMRRPTSRDNRQMDDASSLGSGDYYQGASRPL